PKVLQKSALRQQQPGLGQFDSVVPGRDGCPAVERDAPWLLSACSLKGPGRDLPRVSQSSLPVRDRPGCGASAPPPFQRSELYFEGSTLVAQPDAATPRGPGRSVAACDRRAPGA